ncbi:hypothetical protein ACX8Z9_04635 [Arthrobacter halodurans]|uniref:Helix-turn-helix domain-containing protein n=1 Tax=Arthrobacter halodurans TaxID=516699 RepID=A0ABV4UPW0_9MICC
MAADATAGPVEELLDRLRPGFSSQDLAQAIERVLRRGSGGGSAALTEADQAFWDKHSGMPAEPGLAARGRLSGLVASALHESESLSANQLAPRLGLKPATIRRYVMDRKLYSFKANGRVLFPAWQFDGNRAVPHLAEVLSSFPAGSHPQTVQGFFLTAQPDLRLGGRAATPKEWLLSGGDPAAVSGLAASVGRL